MQTSHDPREDVDLQMPENPREVVGLIVEPRHHGLVSLAAHNWESLGRWRHSLVLCHAISVGVNP